MISDMYPLFGWHKASYINVVAVGGTIAFFFLAAVPITTADVAGFLLLLGNLQVKIVLFEELEGSRDFYLLIPSVVDCYDRPAHGRAVCWQNGQ